MTERIHQSQLVEKVGAAIKDAQLIVILLHGRGADAMSMIPLAEALDIDGMHFLIPQAAHNRWYPQSAFAPLQANEPDLSAALARIDGLVQEAREQGFTDEQIVFGGFSQGACLAAEYAARNARKYGGLFVLSGALIGPPGTPRDYPGAFDGMPVFIGGSDVDPWIPDGRQSETARVFEGMGADLERQIYPGMGHTVNQDEIDRVRAMLVTASKRETG